MTLLVVRDVSRNVFALIVNSEIVAEFPTARAAWEFAEDQFAVAPAIVPTRVSKGD
jgi:hypothetical protein